MGRAFWRTAAVVAGYVVLTVVVLRPTPAQLAHTSPAFGGMASDALLLMAATSHVSRTLFVDPLHLFDAPFFQPARLTLAYSDHMIGQALAGLPIWLATGNPLLEYNLLVLLSYALGGAAAFAYARELGTSRAAAAAAGLVFAFNPYRFHSPLWLQVLFTPFVPLTLLAWLRFVRTRASRAWVAWVACWTLHGLMGLYLTLYLAVVMGALVLYAMVAAPSRDRRLLSGLLAGPIVVGCLLAPTLLPYWILRDVPGHLRTFGLDTQLQFFAPGPGTASARLLGTEMLGRFGPGLTVWALALVGLVASRDARPRAGLPGRFVWRAHVLALATTLALVLVPLDLQQRLPGFDMIRATNRAFYLTLFFLGVFVAEGLDRLTAGVHSSRAARAVAVVAGALLLGDMGTPPRERVTLPVAAGVAPAYRALRDLPGDPLVYERATGPEPLARAMYFQIFHRKRMPTGYAGFWNPASEFAVHRLFRFPAPESLHFMRAIGVTHVLQRFASPAAAAAARDDPAAGLAIHHRAGADVVFRVDAVAAPPDVAVAPLPHDAWTATATGGTDMLANLADGDPATRWTVESTQGTVHRLVLDLGGSRAVAGIRVTTPLERAAGVQWSRIELSDDGRRFTVAPAGFEPDSIRALYEAPATIRWWEARFPPHAARFIRLSNGDLAFWSGEWTIAELDVLAPAP